MAKFIELTNKDENAKLFVNIEQIVGFAHYQGETRIATTDGLDFVVAESLDEVKLKIKQAVAWDATALETS